MCGFRVWRAAQHSSKVVRVPLTIAGVLHVFVFVFGVGEGFPTRMTRTLVLLKAVHDERMLMALPCRFQKRKADPKWWRCDSMGLDNGLHPDSVVMCVTALGKAQQTHQTCPIMVDKVMPVGWRKDLACCTSRDGVYFRFRCSRICVGPRRLLRVVVVWTCGCDLWLWDVTFWWLVHVLTVAILCNLVALPSLPASRGSSVSST